MAVVDQTPIAAYTATGASGSFSFSFQVLQTADLVVLVDGIAQTEGTDYAVSLSETIGGSVFFFTSPTTGRRVVLLRDSDLTRATDYQSQGDLLAAVLNRDFDRIWLVLQELMRGGKAPESALRVPAGETVAALPEAAARAGKLLGFDSGGLPTLTTPSGEDTALALALAASSSIAEGAALVGFNDALTYPAGTVGSALLSLLLAPDEAPTTAIYANVREAPYSAVGDGVANDTAAFQAAINSGQPVWVPPGVYLLDTVTLISGTVIRGAGAGRVTLLQRNTAGTSFGMLHADSGSPSSTLNNISISDLTVLGNVATLGFSEFVHLIHLSGVRDSRVERVAVLGFRGDGIYLGSSPTAGQIRHNYNVVIRDCLIDGLINDNRNGLSVIDVDGLEVTGCTFANCTRSNMPGAIDMEPDSNAAHVVFNVKIHHNTFANIGGNAGAVSLLFIQPLYTLPRNILIESNIFDGRVAGTIGSDVVVSIKRNWVASDPDLGVRIVGNIGRNGGRTVEVYGCKGVSVVGNIWSGYTFGALIGYTNATEQRAIGVRWQGNRCHKVASTSRTGLAIGNATDVDIRANEFVECGDGGAGSRHIGFMGGLSQSVRLIGNRYASPTGLTLAATSVDAGHTLNVASNVEQGEILQDGLTSGFRAYRSDRVVPTVRARLTSTITLAASSGTVTGYVSFNAVEEDNYSWYNGTTGTTTVQLAGLYSVDANALVDYLSPSAVGVPGGGITLQIEVNGTRVATGNLIQNGDPNNACVAAVNVSRPIRLAVGDAVRISLALFANNHTAGIIAGGSGYSTTLAIRYLGA